MPQLNSTNIPNKFILLKSLLRMKLGEKTAAPTRRAGKPAPTESRGAPRAAIPGRKRQVEEENPKEQSHTAALGNYPEALALNPNRDVLRTFFFFPPVYSDQSTQPSGIWYLCPGHVTAHDSNRSTQIRLNFRRGLKQPTKPPRPTTGKAGGALGAKKKGRNAIFCPFLPNPLGKSPPPSPTAWWWGLPPSRTPRRGV